MAGISTAMQDTKPGARLIAGPSSPASGPGDTETSKRPSPVKIELAHGAVCAGDQRSRGANQTAHDLISGANITVAVSGRARREGGEGLRPSGGRNCLLT